MEVASNPLVSAMCLTRNRRDMLSRVIRMFLDQTYEPKELVIFNDFDAEEVQDLVPSGCSNIRVISLPKMNIGAKRAEAISHCKGDIIIHWDDDEIHSAGRMTDQVQNLLDSGKEVTGYYEFKARDEAGNTWLYAGQTTFVCGSSLCYRKTFAIANPFESLDIGEDNLFCATANRLKTLSSGKAEDFLIVGIHPGNTDRKRVECPPWRKIG